MHCIGAGHLGSRDDHRNVQVAAARRWRADAHGLVGELHVKRVGICRRVDGDRLEAHLATRADHAQRDLTTVRDQDFLEHRYTAILKSGWPYSTGAPSSTRIPTTVPPTSASISFMSFI